MAASRYLFSESFTCTMRSHASLLLIACLPWALRTHAVERRFKPGDEIMDGDGEPCRILSVDAEDLEKPYGLGYPNGEVFWAAELGITLRRATPETMSEPRQPNPNPPDSSTSTSTLSGTTEPPALAAPSEMPAVNGGPHRDVKFLVFQGGGVKGIAFGGVAQVADPTALSYPY